MFKLSNLAISTQVNALSTLLDDGWLDIYDGEQPSSSNKALTKNEHVLASLHFGNPAFKAARNEIAEATKIDSEMDAPRSGFATWYRLTMADHKTVVADGSIGKEDADLILNITEIKKHAEVSINSFKLKGNKG